MLNSNSKWDVGGIIIQGLNPSYEMIAAEQNSKHPGAMGIELILPVMPPLTIRLYFDRNNAEKFLNNFRNALDITKGLAK